MPANVVAIIQARLSSSRFPGKVLKEVGGRPLLSYMLERVRGAKLINKIMIATTVEAGDQPIADFSKNENVDCYRGDLNDVLDRYYQAATQANAEIVVRLTSDCPVIDPVVIDRVVKKYLDASFDYVANTAPPVGTYPDGMDVEVCSYKVLKKAWEEAKKPSEREHVTFYIWQNPAIFRTFRLDLPRSFSNFRFTVDYPQDFELISTVLTELYPQNPLFTMEELIEFVMSKPALRELNSGIGWGQGWKPSLEKDKHANKS